MFQLNTLTDYSEESLLAEMRRVSSEFKGRRLTQEKFNEISRVHSSTLSKRFGSWQNALDRAGINDSIVPRVRRLTRELVLKEIQAYATEFGGQSPQLEAVAKRLGAGKQTINHKFGKWSDLLSAVGMKPVPLGRRYSDEECFENIVALWTHYGRQPKFSELNRHPSTVGSKAYVRRWGGWRRALGAFIEYVEQPTQDSQSEVPATFGAQTASVIALQTLPDSVPRSINLALRYKVLCRDRFRCQICGRSPAKDISVELHVDHVTPWSKGGSNVEENLRTLCFDCNLGKGAKLEIT